MVTVENYHRYGDWNADHVKFYDKYAMGCRRVYNERNKMMQLSNDKQTINPFSVQIQEWNSLDEDGIDSNRSLERNGEIVPGFCTYRSSAYENW